MHDAVFEFGEFAGVPAVGGTYQVAGDALQGVDVMAVAVRAFGVLTYMYSIAAYVVAAVNLAASTALCLIVPGRPFFDMSLSSLLVGGLIFGYSYLFLFYVADWMDNRIRFSFRTIPVMIGGFFANLIVGIFNEIVGLIRCGDQQHWVKTEHAIGAAATQENQAVSLQHKAA